jgi:hypothetical protein
MAINTSGGWTTSATWPTPQKREYDEIVQQAKKDFEICEQWEANTRILFDYDYKFAEGDAHNNYQWDAGIYARRKDEDRPCLTINKVQQHNLMIINDAKQNKPGIRIRPVGDQATFEAAQCFQDIIYHIEYISGAENVYDNATEFQVKAGFGYWRLTTEYVSENSFDQEIYIRRIKDPRSVYLDPFINEVDGSDARLGFIFEDVPKQLFEKQYPKFAMIAQQTVIGNAGNSAGWITNNTVRVAEYFIREEKEDTLVTWTNPNDGVQILRRESLLNDMEKAILSEIRNNKELQRIYAFRERDVLTQNVKWYKIAGDRVIDETEWPGKYIPIIRLIGSETVIDGILDRKGHTRALINAQQMYNYNTSANIEFGALQTKSPYIAASASIEGYEEYYKTANVINHSYLPYNAYDEVGNALPPPERSPPPQASPAYVQSMQIANQEMMMASGQYQAQFGEQENAKSGVAINARQRQGDRATYHFIDNQAIAIRYTGKQIIDLIPKVYDTERILKIITRDGTPRNIKIDPNAKQAFQKVEGEQITDNGKIVEQIIFNPNVGMYDIQSDVGPSFATRRQDAFNAMMNLASAMGEKFMGIGGDLLFKVAEFPESDILAERWRRAIPPDITGDEIPAPIQQAMNMASDEILKLRQELAEKEMALKNRDGDLALKAMKQEFDQQIASMKLQLEFQVAAVREIREDYKAYTQRMKDLYNTHEDGSGADSDLKAVKKQLVQQMLAEPEPNSEDLLDDEEPPIEGARKAPDGNWYIQNEQGGYSRIDMQ